MKLLVSAAPCRKDAAAKLLVVWCKSVITLTSARCTELGLLSRCHQLSPRPVSDVELAKMHTPELISLLRSTAGEANTDKLEDISANYDAIYLHPVRLELKRCLPHLLV